MKKKVFFITGSAGFIGFHLSKLLLEKNFKVISVDNFDDYYDVKIKKDRIKILKKFKNFKIFKADITNEKKIRNNFLKVKKIDFFIHLAAQAGVRYSLVNRKKYLSTNVIGFFNLIEIIKERKEIKHFLFASTSSVYGANLNKISSESDKTDFPIQFYAATKKSNEIFAYAYSKLYKIPTTGLRFFTVYGPWGRPDMALFKFTKNILSGNNIDIFNFGNHKRDFTFIDDLTQSVFKICFKPPQKKNNYFRILNICKGKQNSLFEFIKQIEKKLTKKAKYNLLPLQTGDIPSTLGDNRKLKSLIVKTPETSISKGIKSFIKWYLDYHKK
jgi:UDP-glucuronate 4-epimerase